MSELVNTIIANVKALEAELERSRKLSNYYYIQATSKREPDKSRIQAERVFELEKQNTELNKSIAAFSKVVKQQQERIAELEKDVKSSPLAKIKEIQEALTCKICHSLKQNMYVICFNGHTCCGECTKIIYKQGNHKNIKCPLCRGVVINANIPVMQDITRITADILRLPHEGKIERLSELETIESIRIAADALLGVRLYRELHNKFNKPIYERGFYIIIPKEINRPTIWKIGELFLPEVECFIDIDKMILAVSTKEKKQSNVETYAAIIQYSGEVEVYKTKTTFKYTPKPNGSCTVEPIRDLLYPGKYAKFPLTE
jgi:hypothetical protein